MCFSATYLELQTPIKPHVTWWMLQNLQIKCYQLCFGQNIFSILDYNFRVWTILLCGDISRNSCIFGQYLYFTLDHVSLYNLLYSWAVHGKLCPLPDSKLSIYKTTWAMVFRCAWNEQNNIKVNGYSIVIIPYNLKAIFELQSRTSVSSKET